LKNVTRACEDLHDGANKDTLVIILYVNHVK
jgi:hypothetical protein